MNLARTISSHSRAVMVTVLLLCIAGLYAAWQLPTAIFPNTDFPRIIITVENGESPPDQMLAMVTQPIEEKMNGLPGIQRVKSITSRGSAEINLYFDWKTDPKESLALVQARLPEINLPPTATITHVDRLTFAVFPVIGYSLTSDKRDLTVLRDIGQFTIRPQLAVYTQLGSEFLPVFDEGAFILDYIAPPGSSLAETDRMLNHVEEILKDTPEVESFSRRTGMQLGMAGVTEPNTGDFAVKMKANRKRATAKVIDDIRGEIESSEPALDIEFMGIIADLIGDLASAPQPIEIKLFSDDKAALHAKVAEVEDEIKKIDGVVDTLSGVVVSGPAVTFKVDKQSAAKFGVTASDVAAAVEAAMNGTKVSTILQRGRPVAVRVVFPADSRGSLDAVRALQIRSSSGAGFRLDQVATVDYDAGQTEMHRDGLRQTAAVTARITGSDLGGTITKIKADLSKNVKFPAGMTVEYGGLYAEQQSSFRELAISLTLAIVLVFLVLLIEFRSFSHPFAIVAGAILALSGVRTALLVTRSTVNVVSLMGMIMVVGIVAKNGILMLDAVAENLEKTGDLTEALMLSGRRRFRPVLMTSLAAILGMLPLALALGSGAELLQPLAIAVIGGLLFALLLSLIVTPTVYAILTDRSASKVEREG